MQNINVISDINFPLVKYIDERFYNSRYLGISIIIDKKTGYCNATKFCSLYKNNRRFKDWMQNYFSIRLVRFINGIFFQNKSDIGCLYSLNNDVCNELKGTYVHKILLANVVDWCEKKR
jgi:hypothetical protein